MAFNFKIDADRRVVVFNGSASFSSQELFESLSRIVSDPMYEPGFDHLVDLTGVERDDVGKIELRIKASADARMAEKIGNGRCAFVAANDRVFGLTQEYKKLMSRGPMEIESFMDMAEAEEWLGLDS